MSREEDSAGKNTKDGFLYSGPGFGLLVRRYFLFLHFHIQKIGGEDCLFTNGHDEVIVDVVTYPLTYLPRSHTRFEL